LQLDTASDLIRRMEPEQRKMTALLLLFACLHLAVLKLPLPQRAQEPQDTIVMVGLYTDSRPGSLHPPVATARPRTSSKPQTTKAVAVHKAEPNTIALNKAKSIAAPQSEQVASTSNEQGPESPAPVASQEGSGTPGATSMQGGGFGSSPVETGFGAGNGPRFKHQVAPQYPLMARRQGIDGRVLLRLTIGDDGRLVNVEVVEDAPCGFVAAALNAVKRSTFYPALVDGRPVTSRALLPIRFSLKEST